MVWAPAGETLKEFLIHQRAKKFDRGRKIFCTEKFLDDVSENFELPLDQDIPLGKLKSTLV